MKKNSADAKVDQEEEGQKPVKLTGKMWEEKPVHEFDEIALLKFRNTKIQQIISHQMDAHEDLKRCPRLEVGKLLMVIPRNALSFLAAMDSSNGNSEARDKDYEVFLIKYVPNLPWVVHTDLKVMDHHAKHSIEKAELPQNNPLSITKSKVIKSPYFEHMNEKGESMVFQNYVIDEIAYKVAFDALVRHEKRIKV